MTILEPNDQTKKIRQIGAFVSDESELQIYLLVQFIEKCSSKMMIIKIASQSVHVHGASCQKLALDILW